MQRLFSMFPQGLPGLALLLLRATVALALLFENYGHGHGQPAWASAVAIIIAIAILLGYMTPIGATLALVFHVSIWFALGDDNAAVAAVFSLNATALALLGPGAYSIDSYRFGRRVVVLPPPP